MKEFRLVMIDKQNLENIKDFLGVEKIIQQDKLILYLITNKEVDKDKLKIVKDEIRSISNVEFKFVEESEKAIEEIEYEKRASTI